MPFGLGRRPPEPDADPDAPGRRGRRGSGGTAVGGTMNLACERRREAAPMLRS